MSDPLILYKLMILHMLKQVKFPLTGAQIADFFLTKDYTTYFTLQQALSGLKEAHLIKLDSGRKSSRYEITREGEQTLSLFHNDVSPAIIEDIDSYLQENKVRFRDEVSLVADYDKSANQDYIVHCAILEGKGQLLELNISVPDKEQAEHMCDRWTQESQSLYSIIMQHLMKD